MRAVLLIFTLGYATSIGYSRIILGAHSWNQTLFGWQLGLWIACTTHFVFRDRLFSCLRDLHDGTRTDWSSLSLKCGLLLFLTIALEVVNYVCTTPRIEKDPVWYVNIINKCPKAKMDQAFEAKSLLDAGIVGVGFGAYLGMMFHAKNFPRMLIRVPSSDNRWYTWPLLRCVVGIVVNIPLLCLYLLKPKHISNMYVLAFFKTFIPTFGGAFIIFGPLDWICMKLGILTFEGDPELNVQSSVE